MQVQPVEQRPRETGRVARHRGVVAAAVAAREAPAARARVRGRHELQARREDGARARPGHHDLAFLQHLAQRLQAAALELGELVEEEDAVVRPRHEAGTQPWSPADHGCVARRVMRSQEGPREAIVPGGAVAFLGQSGAGKSTLAASFALDDSAFLTDDALLIEESEGTCMALPSHASVRLWDDICH